MPVLISLFKNNYSDLKNEISKLKIENDLFKDEISNLKEDNIKLQTIIDELEEYHTKDNHKKPIEKYKITDFIKNNKYKNRINFIFEFLNKNMKISFSKVKLIYRSSLHGDNTKTLHELCDNKQNILIIIKSNYGCLFGGYSKIGFKTNNKNIEQIDNHSFLFSITNQKIYPVINNKPVICQYSNHYGLCFYHSLYFYDYFTHNNMNYISAQMEDYFNPINLI